MENKTVTENSTVSCAEEMNTAEVYGSDQYAADLKTASKDRQTSGKQRSSSKFSTMSMVQVAIFGAVICVMAFTPFLGYIPLGFTRATIIHIPVIIASLLMGPKKGGALGFLFGLTSFINNTMNPTPTSFVFTPFYSIAGVSGGWGSVIICFLPRILVGIIPYYVYKLIIRFSNEKTKKTGVSSIGLVTAGVAGAMTNTLLVMNLIFLFFREAYASANNVAVSGVYTFILSIIGINNRGRCADFMYRKSAFEKECKRKAWF